jgi:aspartate carbamoyltransferase catalytic subunit
MRHLLTVDDLKEEDLANIMYWTNRIHTGHPPSIQNKILATMFFEPSTRTKLSFQSAMYRLGSNVIDLPVESSMKKGETDLDTVRTVSEYADILVIRHPVAGIMKKLADASDKPVINAGDGAGEHPTQALLDLYTIGQYQRDKKEIVIMFTGDLYYSRTVLSLIPLLQRGSTKFKLILTNRINPYLISSDHPMQHMDERDIKYHIDEVDVLYMTRPQKERWENGGRLPEGEPSSFILTKELANRMKQDAIIMHPLPRNEEISPDVDDNPRAKYFQQVRNGLYVRMAILHHML